MANLIEKLRKSRLLTLLAFIDPARQQRCGSRFSTKPKLLLVASKAAIQSCVI
jgi:hypothetical protein